MYHRVQALSENASAIHIADRPGRCVRTEIPERRILRLGLAANLGTKKQTTAFYRLNSKLKSSEH